MNFDDFFDAILFGEVVFRIVVWSDVETVVGRRGAGLVSIDRHALYGFQR